jgi:hypothetical protein
VPIRRQSLSATTTAGLKKTDPSWNEIRSFFEDYWIGAGNLSALSFRRGGMSQTTNENSLKEETASNPDG